MQIFLVLIAANVFGAHAKQAANDEVKVQLIVVPKEDAIDVQIVADLPKDSRVTNNTVVVHQLQSGFCPFAAAAEDLLVATIVAASNVHHVRGLVPNTAYRVTVYVDYTVPSYPLQQRSKPLVAQTTTLSAAPGKPDIRLVNVTNTTAAIVLSIDCTAQHGNISHMKWWVEHVDDSRLPAKTSTYYFYRPKQVLKNVTNNGTTDGNYTTAAAVPALENATDVTDYSIFNVSLPVEIRGLYPGNRIRVRAAVVNSSGSEGQIGELTFNTPSFIKPLKPHVDSIVDKRASKVVTLFVPNQNGVKLTKLVLWYRPNASDEEQYLAFSYPSQLGLIKNYDVIWQAELIIEALTVFTATIESLGGYVSERSSPMLIGSTTAKFVFVQKNATDNGKLILAWVDDPTRVLEDPLTASLIYGVLGGGCLLIFLIATVHQTHKYRERRRNESIREKLHENDKENEMTLIRGMNKMATETPSSAAPPPPRYNLQYSSVNVIATAGNYDRSSDSAMISAVQSPAHTSVLPSTSTATQPYNIADDQRIESIDS